MADSQCVNSNQRRAPMRVSVVVICACAWRIAAGDERPSFDARVAPLLAGHCLECHGGAEPKGGLDLASRQRAFAGGDSGRVIQPGGAEESLLWQRVRDGEMPPEEPLPDEEKETLRRWIVGGAEWGTDPIDPFRYTTRTRAGYDWWALQPVERPRVPDVANPQRVRNPIDAFVLKRLEERGLSLSPEADRRTLVRRLSLDLLGLPPAPAEADAFLSDSSPAAYERLINGMLASPHYGERWARHWLDVARYGESQGFERDKLRPNAWRYRDWVIRALNDDLPYDEFARLQLAGDVLRPDDPAAVTATGFLVAGPYDEVGQAQQSAAMKAVVRQDELEDIVGTVGQTFLGLTVHCSRCHDHKFDPIRQKEYYQLTAALGGVRHGERSLLTPEEQRQLQQFEGRLADVSDRLKVLDADADAHVPQGQPTATTAGRSGEQAQRAAWEAEAADLENRIAAICDEKVYAVTPRPPDPAHLLIRGNTASPGEAVEPDGIAAIRGLSADFELPADASDADRRRRLAAWITDTHNPLFARVIVNRVWHYHFGMGLVETPNDFGFNGGRPSHPQLLDWLASELIDSGWSLKALHRLIVTSSTWRQSSLFRDEAAALDAGNRLLWRKDPDRLDAETLRDAILHVSGQMNRQYGGPPFRDFRTFENNSQFYEMLDPVGSEFNRRTVYRTWCRSARNRFLDAFDCPDPSTTTPRRAVTTTPLQSLALLNNSFVLRMSDRMAQRLTQEAGDDPAMQTSLAFQLAYTRPASEDELTAGAAFIREHGLPALCRVIFNSNEFLYVD